MENNKILKNKKAKMEEDNSHYKKIQKRKKNKKK